MFLDKEILNFIQTSITKKLDIAITCVTKTQGSTYAKKGNILAVNSQGDWQGVLGSPYLHSQILELSKTALETKSVQTFESIPKDESTGHGQSQYSIEPFFYTHEYKGLSNYMKKPYSLLIFGSAAHVTALVLMANLMGWKTTIIDMKMQNEFVKEADERIQLKSLEEIHTMDLSSYDASVILSHSPTTDHVYLEALLNSPIEYIGMMGNKQNMQRIKKEFQLEKSSRFFAPIGLDIGGNTSQAIALSICAQIEAKKNGKL